jgi:hypothetical protein
MKIKLPNVVIKNKVNMSAYCKLKSSSGDGARRVMVIPFPWQSGSFPKNPQAGTSGGGPSRDPGQWISAKESRLFTERCDAVINSTHVSLGLALNSCSENCHEKKSFSFV